VQPSIRHDESRRNHREPILAETVDLKLKKSIDTLQLTKVVVRRDGPVPDEQQVKGLKEFARSTMKQFSHTREKEKLKQYVYGHFVIGDTFALGISMSILALISLGIQGFSKKKQEKFPILCDVITIAFLKESMKTWTQFITFLKIWTKFSTSAIYRWQARLRYQR
jgi:hypothetical protein